jgi:hypothetical protein
MNPILIFFSDLIQSSHVITTFQIYAKLLFSLHYPAIHLMNNELDD